MTERYLYPEGKKKLEIKKAVSALMILLTYLQRKTRIILSALINISDVSRLAMKKVALCVCRARERANIGAI